MKTRVTILAAMLLIAGVVASCEEKVADVPKLTDGFSLDSVAYSLCSSQGDLLSLREYVKLSAVDNQTLRIEQDLTINCCCDSMRVNILPNDLNIVVDVADYGNGCNCPCQGFASYDVVGLVENTTYLFTFKRNNYERHTVSITFTTDVNQTINLNGGNEL